jgi:hypothetical protein
MATGLLFSFGDADAFNLSLLSLLLFIVGLILLLDAKRIYSTIQKIRNTPSSKARSAAMGLVELCGKPILPKGLISPISGEPCLYWRLEYYKYPLLFVKRAVESGTPFMLDDGTGKIQVDPRGAAISFGESSAILHRLSKLAETGKIPKMNTDTDLIKSLGSDTRINEHYLPVVDQLYVLGDAVSEGGNLAVRKKDLLFIGMSSEKDNLGKLTATLIIELMLGLPMVLVLLVVIFRLF